ncbi:hypothetical protein PanWU01x14_131870, partial [Parasponia andersonii]
GNLFLFYVLFSFLIICLYLVKLVSYILLLCIAVGVEHSVSGPTTHHQGFYTQLQVRPSTSLIIGLYQKKMLILVFISIG